MQGPKGGAMSTAKGIHAHGFFKLGKAPAKKDERNFKMAALLKVIPKVPKEWDFDTTNKKYHIPLPMFGNDVYGDCVIAGRAHQTLRFEATEQKKVVSIPEKDVLREYWKEEGGTGPKYDHGLVVLDSIKLWRKKGWKVGTHAYTIHAFAQIDQKDPAEVKTAIFLLTGAGAGLSLPKSARTQLDAGKPWDVTSGPDSRPNSWGGHYVFLSGYTDKGPVCVTWGRKQQMTWAFLNKYCDELYGIVDNKDRFLKKSPVDVEKLEQYLKQL
jgi:hypothetical protein